uniref:POX-D n=1 Tax=Spodoptera exigua TaxID=7107 RepID=A0A088MTF4_SPOEX|nr:POX-D [Spodoptera exigua]
MQKVHLYKCRKVHICVEVLVGFFEVFLASFGTRLDRGCVCVWVPIGWADFAMFVSKLEGLYKPEGLINRSTDRQVVDRHMSKNTVSVNHEQTSKSETSI